MSIYIAPTKTARYNFHQRPGSLWYHKDAAPDQADGMMAFQRLRQPLFRPVISPGFKLQQEDRIFAIGSCFARSIEKVLIERKMNVASAASEFVSGQATNDDLTGWDFINKYNTFSILNELRWALDPAAECPRESIVDLGDGSFWDPHTTPTLPFVTLEETLNRRSILEMVFRRIAECRAVIITLGLVEVWRDKAADIFINRAPVPGVLGRYPDRYELHVTSFAQNLANLEQVYALLSQFGHPDLQFVVTVSPVPLHATFSSEDVVVANCYSKSLLRTVAQEWAATHTNVHYFPSYEIVQNSDHAKTWQADLRHVQDDVVTHIMNTFLDHYLE
jgi:hypothetical protein